MAARPPRSPSGSFSGPQGFGRSPSGSFSGPQGLGPSKQQDFLDSYKDSYRSTYSDASSATPQQPNVFQRARTPNSYSYRSDLSPPGTPPKAGDRYPASNDRTPTVRSVDPRSARSELSVRTW